MTPNVTGSNTFRSLRTFLVSILPATGSDGRPLDVLQAQQNRIPEPRGAEFVIMTEIRRQRISTNRDEESDTLFFGSTSGTVLTVLNVTGGIGEFIIGVTPIGWHGYGTIEIGAVLTGEDVISGTRIVAQLTGTPGGVGTYTITPSQTLANRPLSTGALEIAQATQVAIQLDIHGPSSADNAQTISTLLRDQYGVQSFADQDPNYGVAPLYADDPVQRPFLNDSQQWETRWVVEALLEVHPVIAVSQQYADVVSVQLISVEAVYPP